MYDRDFVQHHHIPFACCSGLVFIPKQIQGQSVVCSDASTIPCQWHPRSSNLSFSYHPSPSLPMFSLVFLFPPFLQSSYVVLILLSSLHSFAQRVPSSQPSQTMSSQMFFNIFHTCPPSYHIIGNPIS
ncbi:unnamed protein product [Clavelina lepadiformis]|uniref:Uncharacterized protein n=1 Tax=Clavelina lepadiformis TaxID=159417 RepID=A0ABP0G6X7_CLALP